MRQTVEIARLLPNGNCEVWVRRKSACGDSCASCGMSGACAATAAAEAENPAGAQPGDLCVVEARTAALNGAAALAYLLPAALGIVGGAILETVREGLAPVGVAAGLALGIAFAFLYAKLRRRKTLLRVVEVLRRGGEPRA